MSILYVFSINGASGQGVFPPSVIASDWFAELSAAITKVAVFNNDTMTGMLFKTQDQLDDYNNTHKLSDPTLLADLETWKAAHGISYTHQYYKLATDDTISNCIFN